MSIEKIGISDKNYEAYKQNITKIMDILNNAGIAPTDSNVVALFNISLTAMQDIGASEISLHLSVHIMYCKQGDKCLRADCLSLREAVIGFKNQSTMPKANLEDMN